MTVKIEESWKKQLQAEFDKPYFKALTDFVRSEYQTKKVFPPARLIFNAFDSCPFDTVKVVIIGQDPYHNVGQAHGLCFSVPDGVEKPPSLINIFKEIEQSTKKSMGESGNLTHWAKQGALLLNATLTVRVHQAGSHQGKGWEQFTDAVIKTVADNKKNVVFILWGNYAQQKAKLINTDNDHLILKSVHPSPLSAYRGFFGNNHFVETNLFLTQKGLSPIEW